MLVERTITSIHDCHGAKILAAADLRDAAFGQAVEQFPHRALKRIGKPDLIPLGSKPNARIPLRRELNGTRHRVRIAGPSDRALSESVRTFDAPLDVVVRRGAFTNRAGPDI